MEKGRMIKKIQEKEKGCDYSLHRVSRFLQPGLLLLLSKGPSYGYELIDRLGGLGFHKDAVDMGAVYKTLRRLEKENFVKSFWSKDKTARKKRYYRITPVGRALLRLWAVRVNERKKALEKFIAVYRGGQTLWRKKEKR